MTRRGVTKVVRHSVLLDELGVDIVYKYKFQCGDSAGLALSGALAAGFGYGRTAVGDDDPGIVVALTAGRRRTANE